MDGTPLTAVFGSNLVPILSKVATDLAARSNIAHELGATIGESGICHGGKACNGSDSKRKRNLFHNQHPFFVSPIPQNYLEKRQILDVGTVFLWIDHP
jgi:hypothetical protein